MIFYFSGTGNTRWAAERLATLTDEKLLFIPEELKRDSCSYELAKEERIGFCFPTHGWQPPVIVREFIKRLSIVNSQGHYCYALTTCGDSIGLTMEMLNRDLVQANLPTATSMFSLTMPESYVCLPFMYTDTYEREQEKIATANRMLEQYAVMIQERRLGEVHTTRGAAPWLMSHVIGSYFNKHMVNDKKFTVDEDLCIGCHRCELVCPTGNILFAKEFPSWQHNGSCTSCLACYHHCPRHAINYGKITRKRGQYYYGHATEKQPISLKKPLT